MKIMIVDDNEIDLLILSYLLKKEDSVDVVLEFKSCKEALTYLKKNLNSPELLPDFIFLDIYMPVMSGFDFIKEFEMLPLPFKNQCRIHMISSSCHPQDRERASSNSWILSLEEKPMTKKVLSKLLHYPFKREKMEENFSKKEKPNTSSI